MEETDLSASAPPAFTPLSAQTGFTNIPYPRIQQRVRARALRVSYTQASVEILAIEDRPPLAKYRAIIREIDFDEANLLCDRIAPGDILECVVVAHGDNVLFLSLHI